MTDHIGDANKMVSPWSTLAESLGMQCGADGLLCGSDCGFSGDYGHGASGYIDSKEVQDLLIGRALRVAWDAYLSSFPVDTHVGQRQHEFDGMVSVELLTGQRDARAIAALKLLDAVGYGVKP